ncbi:MAG: lyase family protein, partial [Rhodospirillales bacterium]|nr:lyase family protein [Rhodospirillales bacterium]
CRDMWSYISRGILGQNQVAGEVGSSTMPHKINPIQFENAEGNMGIANALLNHLATKLPISRMQRDLSDSTSLRNQGVALGHSYLALQNILKGLSRITINKIQMSKELGDRWEVLAEAVQTILRKSGRQDAYEQLKELTRGQSINTETLAKFVSGLKIPEEDKQTLINLTPESYIGLAPKLVDLI